VLWEVFGELGTSHAYARAPGGGAPAAGLGLLGADIERSGDAWRLTRVVRGDTSDPRARAPLAAPGAGIGAGDVLLAVDGRPIGPDGPGPQHSPAHSDLYGIGCAGPGTCYAIGDDGTILALS
jgi:tricorn protease